MTAPRKLQGYRYLPLCLLLLSACAMAGIRELPAHGPADTTAEECTDADSNDVVATPAAKTVAPATKPAGAARIKPVVTVRSGGDGSGHSSRWHSFLPGMFR
ncbi:MAG: hypothetical protein ABIR05_02345 [Luteimonas sp.]